MIQKLKQRLYFPLAYYFAFWARIQLSLWQPRIIIITGSSGKTTLLHLIESQLGEKARYSHHANSSYGIPFDILGLHRKKLTIDEWIYLFLAAPFKAFKKPYSEKLYIVEADCDRPYEGQFLGTFLKSEATIWLNLSRTHSMNFDNLVSRKKFQSVEEAIAFEFGNYLEHTSKLAIANADSKLIKKQLARTKANKILINKAQLKSYEVFKGSTKFKIGIQSCKLNFLLPKNTFYSIEATRVLMRYLKVNFDSTFSGFNIPPGRSSVFRGIKNTTILDSSYNSNLDSTSSILELFSLYPGNNKWVVLGDMLEQGEGEKKEHENLAQVIGKYKFDRIILMGPRIYKHTYSRLRPLMNNNIPIERFEKPKEVLDYLVTNISGGETILFKGVRFLEGVIEHLLANKEDEEKLCRREVIWQIRRKKWDL